MKLIPRNGVFYIHFVDSAGYRKRISTGTSDEALANVKAVEIMREHMVETLPDAQRKKLALTITVAGSIATAYEKIWASQRGAREKRYTIGKIAREIGQWPLQRVTFARLQDWADDAIKAGRSPATMNRHLAAVHTALTLAVKRGELDAVPPFPHYAENNIKERYLSDDEEFRTLEWFAAHTAAADEDLEYMRNLFITLLYTGMRCNEAITLGEGNVHRDGEGFVESLWLRHGSTKNGKGRTVPLTEVAKTSVVALLASPLHGHVDSNWASRKWRRLAATIGLPGVGLHTLRHTCASRLVQAGVSLYVVKEWLGHSSIKITERYAHLAPKQFGAALAALEGRAVDRGSASGVSQLSGTVPEPECQKEKNGTRGAVFSNQNNHINGAPGEIRTPDHLVRSQVLYPTELRAH